MTFNGKEVFTQETFSYSKAQVGDYVSQAVVDDAMDCLPPVCMSSACSQVGEPHSTRLDPDTGKYRNTYATFSLQYPTHCIAIGHYLLVSGRIRFRSSFCPARCSPCSCIPSSNKCIFQKA